MLLPWKESYNPQACDSTKAVAIASRRVENSKLMPLCPTTAFVQHHALETAAQLQQSPPTSAEVIYLGLAQIRSPASLFPQQKELCHQQQFERTTGPRQQGISTRWRQACHKHALSPNVTNSKEKGRERLPFDVRFHSCLTAG